MPVWHIPCSQQLWWPGHHRCRCRVSGPSWPSLCCSHPAQTTAGGEITILINCWTCSSIPDQILESSSPSHPAQQQAVKSQRRSTVDPVCSWTDSGVSNVFSLCIHDRLSDHNSDQLYYINKYISKVLNPSKSNLQGAQSEVHVQLKPNKTSDIKIQNTQEIKRTLFD